MEWLQSLLDQSTMPPLTALLLGLVCALSPCPLATNIAAIGYIAHDIENRRRIFLSGFLYTLGRIVSYTLLGLILIIILRKGSDTFGLQQGIAEYGSMFIGPLLIIIGLFLLFGDKLPLAKWGLHFDGERMGRQGLWGAFLFGLLFAMAFCPTSGVLYFGMLIPMSATVTLGYLLPVIFALGTALPVIFVAWVFAFSAHRIGKVYGRIKSIQKWLNISVGCIFVFVGILYLFSM